MIQIPAGNEVSLKKKMRIKPTYTVYDLFLKKQLQVQTNEKKMQLLGNFFEIKQLFDNFKK